MKISSKQIKILTVFCGILLILSLNFFQKEIKNFFYCISAPIQKWFWEIGNNVSDFLGAISGIKTLKKENDELKLKIQSLLSENLALKEIKKENEFLREGLEIGLEREFKLTFVEIIGKDISQDSLLINKGSKDGILKNLPVITQQKTLIGKINEVYENFSKVMLISNKEISFDAKISDTEIYGVVRGKGNFKLYLDLVPHDKEIKVGDLVITAALGDVFPKGLLIGKIKEVKKSDIELFQKAEIENAFDVQELKLLFVIKEW